MAQATWTHPRTNRLLFDAGASFGYNVRDQNRLEGITSESISILEQTTGLRYGASGSSIGSTGSYGTGKTGHNINERAALSYVTGSHAIKVGFQAAQGIGDDFTEINQSVTYTFRAGVPLSLTQYVSPAITKARSRNTGLYAQDQWSVQRLTLNYGVRYDSLRSFTLADDIPASRFSPARHFDSVPAANWKDISPRLGAAYDLFGNGKTAFKGSFGRFVMGTTGGTSLANRLHPANSALGGSTRTWADANRNFVPDCDLQSFSPNGECGGLDDSRLFGTGRPTITVSDDYKTGWGNRDRTWRWSGALQHELRPGFGVNLGYFGTAFGNVAYVQNAAVTPADYSPYCVTAPTDARLPGGGGNNVCGYWDINPSKLGLINTVWNPGSDYGDPKQQFHAIDIGVNARLPRRATLQGGVSTGTMSYDACFALDKPNVTVNVQDPIGSTNAIALDNRAASCKVSQPWGSLTQVKAFASSPLVWGLEASVNLQNLPGVQSRAILNATSAQIAPSLGRNLAAGAAATTALPLLPPFSLWEARLNQVDIRFTKVIRVGGVRMKGMFDIYNAFNAATVLATNSIYGAAWLRPTSILAPRLFKLGVDLTY